MMLLRLLTWPYLRKHKVRSLLTVAGIALGVVVFVAMRTANDSVLAAFQQTVDRIAGSTQLQITAGDAGFPEEVLERVQALREVGVAVPVIEAEVEAGAKQGNILVLAVDMTGDRGLRQYEFEDGEESVIDDPLVFLAQPDSIILTREFAARNGLAVNSRVPMATMDGQKEFVVRGIMRSSGLASAFGGNLAIMDIYAAQKVFGRGRTFDRIDLRAADGVTVDACKAAVEKAVGPGFQVDPPASRGKQFESIAQIFSIGANLNSMFALLIGLFIIYNTFSIAVEQRRSEIGIVRALGASRRQIRALFVGESLAMGLLGSATGVVCGLAVARAMAGFLGEFLATVYGVAQRVETVSVDPGILGAAFLAGSLTSVVAAWIPAREAARVNPVQALHKGSYEAISSRENRGRSVAAVLLVMTAAGCWILGGSSGVRLYVGYASVVIGSVLLAPRLIRWLMRALRPVLEVLRPVEGVLAADSLLQAPRRTSATVAALMLSLALVVGLGGIARASHDSILEWMNNSLNPDLFVGSTGQLASRSFRFPAAMGEDLKKLPEVEDVQMVRTSRVAYRDTLIMIVAVDMESLGRRVKPRVIAGDGAKMFSEAAAGKGVIAADNLALMQKLKLGTVIEIPTPGGILKLPVLGIVTDYSDQQGALLMDRGLFARMWNDDSVHLFRVYLKKGVTPEQGRVKVTERFAGQRKVHVLTNEDVRQFILKVTEQWFALTYMQIFVAVLVAILGIVNSLTVSITDRKRELGVLQAVGGLRKQVRHTIWMEALSIGWLGLVLGLALGGLILYYYLGILQNDVGGIRLTYRYPFGLAMAMVPVMLAAAMLSAVGPAETAVRGSLVEALEYE